jgi:hypothetical protein
MFRPSDISEASAARDRQEDELKQLVSEIASKTFNDAASNAILYGVGFIRISYIEGVMVMSCVDREEFRDAADHLIWLDNNAKRETVQ